MPQLNRREFVLTSAAAAAVSGLPWSHAHADELPAALADFQQKYYNFLGSLVSSPNIKDPLLVMNNTITPLDADPKTPYYNQELFRLYADQTFSSPTTSLIAPGAMNQSGRFSTIYRDTVGIAASQVDQDHPEIAQVVTDLQGRLTDAQKAFQEKDKQFNEQWADLSRSRGLQPGTREYTLNYLKWLEDVRYNDQMATYSTAIDRLNSQIRTVRRSKYTASQVALLDNVDALDSSFDIARPRYAQTELDQLEAGQRLTDLTLADPHQTPAALFDRSPLILPIADLKKFLTGTGGRSFDSTTQSAAISSGSSSWSGSGGASFFGWSVGGGGSGSSSYRKDVESSKALKLSFKNVDEIYIDRGQWFNPGVLQDKSTFELVKTLTQLQYLKYVAVSLFIARGTTLSLELKNNASSSDWSTQSFSGHGGGSFFGFSFGGGGGSSRTSSNFTSDANGTTITFADGEDVIRVLGARVEPFLQIPASNALAASDIPDLSGAVADMKAGKITYLEYQKRRAAIPSRTLP
ncbi:hypothetical protein [Bradyrhizobium sp. 23]|uniref:hypothetical protein n=1 Tax=Bradyrhizobium sp. 23 TaxID=2782667 RepID=UPI001FF912C1|nr:hypothetical protein [Bradyrhizobium sp. 23]MCK1316807.1 hypothetical protein [Bradyrhizobium sp. 23]